MSTTEGRTIMVQGRIVWTSGDLFQGKPKLDLNTKQPKIDKQGQPIMEYGFGLAVPKSVLNQAEAGQPGEIWSAIHAEAYTLYPSRQLPPGFAWKYKDGDGVDHNGQSFADREGHAEHLIFACTTTIPIKYFRLENGNNFLINEGIKCGDYVNVQLGIKAHGPVGQGKAGLYLNPLAVQLIGYGAAIINMPSGNQIFGTVAPPLPQGASLTPLAPMPGPLIPSAPMSGPALAPQSIPAYGSPPVVQQAQATPHYGVVPQAFQPAMPQMQGYNQQPAAPAMPQMPGGFPYPGQRQ